MFDSELLGSIHLARMRHAGSLRPDEDSDVTFQTSTIDAVLDGAYDGDVTFAELATHGDFGIGTLQGLDGEMIAIDGQFLVARVDGSVSIVPPATKAPFAVVVRWTPHGRGELPACGTMTALAAAIERCVPPGPDILALRIDGRFSHLRVRSVPKQTPPYRPLSEVAAQQTVFEWDDVEGTLAGFRFPASARGYEVVGYHLHFVSADRQRGGHVLDCALTAGSLQYHHSNNLHVEIPKGVTWHPPHSSEAKDAALTRIEESR